MRSSPSLECQPHLVWSARLPRGPRNSLVGNLSASQARQEGEILTAKHSRRFHELRFEVVEETSMAAQER